MRAFSVWHFQSSTSSVFSVEQFNLCWGICWPHKRGFLRPLLSQTFYLLLELGNNLLNGFTPLFLPHHLVARVHQASIWPAEKRSRSTVNPLYFKCLCWGSFILYRPTNCHHPWRCAAWNSGQNGQILFQDGVQARRASHTDTSPTTLATLISIIVDENRGIYRQISSCSNLNSLRLNLCNLDKLPPFATHRRLRLQPSQPSQCQQQHSFPIFQGQSPLSAHVPTKVKRATLKGEYVEFVAVLPENSRLSDNDLPGLSISFIGKPQRVPPSSRKK